MSSEMHPLAERYVDALFELPAELRARKDLDDELAAHMTGGHHLCIRGFQRIGKTTLMTGVLQRACERSGGAAFVMELSDPDRDDGLPQTVESVLNRLTTKVNEFLQTVGAKELKADPKKPLEVLGELAAPLYVGFDEAVALVGLKAEGMATVFEALLTTPKNVKVAVVCARHREADGAFESLVVNRAGVATVVVPPVTDDELVTLVQEPAQSLGVTFENEALGALAEITGNRPWEVLRLCALLASRFPKDFKGAVKPEQVDELVNLDVLGESEHGQALVEHHLRTLVAEMSAEERTVMELLSAGKEGEATEDALVRLQEAGYVVANDEGYAINGALIEFVSRAIVEGAIKVSTE
jgi:molybdopterin-guanine dinucleotide biosynthesis protein